MAKKQASGRAPLRPAAVVRDGIRGQAEDGGEEPVDRDGTDSLGQSRRATYVDEQEESVLEVRLMVAPEHEMSEGAGAHDLTDLKHEDECRGALHGATPAGSQPEDLDGADRDRNRASIDRADGTPDQTSFTEHAADHTAVRGTDQSPGENEPEEDPYPAFGRATHRAECTSKCHLTPPSAAPTVQLGLPDSSKGRWT